jgi:hypothetical protein
MQMRRCAARRASPASGVFEISDGWIQFGEAMHRNMIPSTITERVPELVKGGVATAPVRRYLEKVAPDMVAALESGGCE